MGWSWKDPAHASAPFCAADRFGSSCSSGPCEEMGGSPWGSRTCIEGSSPFTVVGPTCWQGKCVPVEDEILKEIQGRCEKDLGGYNHGLYPLNDSGDGSFWCFVPGTHTVLGPLCYGDSCFDEELKIGCSSLGGIVYDRFCVLDTKYTVIGPVCQPDMEAEICFPGETKQVCTMLGGTSMGNDLFCVVEGEYSVLGPFCFGLLPSPNSTDPFCRGDEGQRACESFGGASLGDGLFCVLRGRDYHVWSSHWGGVFSGIDEPCREKFGGVPISGGSCLLRGDYTVGLPSFWNRTQFLLPLTTPTILDSSIGFLMEGSYKIYGPNCWGQSCSTAGKECENAGGIDVGGIFCAVTSASLSTGIGVGMSVLSAAITLHLIF